MRNVSAARDRLIGDAALAWASKRRGHVAAMIGELASIPTPAPREPDLYPAVADYANTAGFQARIEPAHPSLAEHQGYTAPFLPGRHQPRANLRAWRQAGSEQTVLFSAHADVVPPFEHPEPWSGRFDGTHVHGRGTADTKANIVMVIEALRCMAELGIRPRANVALDVVSDEEAGGNGALSTILHGCPADEVVVLEPTSLEIFLGHRGCLSFTMVSESPPAHMGEAGARANPVQDCLEVVTALRRLADGWLSEARSWPEFAGPPPPIQLNVSGIRAESWHGASPRRCSLDVSLGFLPNRSPGQARSEITAAIDAAGDSSRRTILWEGIHNDAFLGSAGGQAATELRRSAHRYGAGGSRPRGWHVSCDARLYGRVAGLDTVIFGCGDLDQAHTDHEAVLVDQVTDGIAILVDFLSLQEPQGSRTSTGAGPVTRED